MANQSRPLVRSGKCFLFSAMLVLILGCSGVAGVLQPTMTGQASTGEPPVLSPKPSKPAAGPQTAVPAQTGLVEPVLTDFYVSPSGSDTNDGLAPSRPFKTLTTAWGHIPQGSALTGTGYRINFLPGVYPCEPSDNNCQNYVADRLGTEQFPVILRAYQGPGTVTLRGGFDFNHMQYLSLIDLKLVGGASNPTNNSGNNLLHFASSSHILLHGLKVIGPDCPNDGCNNLQEVLKVNQAEYFDVEESEISGAWHSVVDYFSVQYGRFERNQVSTAGQWCMYIKGGTSYLQVEGNLFHDCQLGFQAGQSSNLTVMRSPWVQYEAYDIKFVNNVLYNLPGIALSVSGGYNVLMAYNTLYRVGTGRDPGYALFQVVHGERGCNATSEIPSPLSTCQSLLSAGGWGPNFITTNRPVLPNKNVFVYNNLIYNPSGSQTQYNHFSFEGPLNVPAGFVNIPSPSVTDQNLVLKGNVIWNGPADQPLGIEEGTGCQPSNPTCNASQLTLENKINLLLPQLINPERQIFHPLLGGNLYLEKALAIPDFVWNEGNNLPGVPAGNLSNSVLLDFDGKTRVVDGPPGAFATSDAPPLPQLYVFLPLVGD
jgi:hypothetical protein